MTRRTALQCAHVPYEYYSFIFASKRASEPLIKQTASPVGPRETGNGDDKRANFSPLTLPSRTLLHHPNLSVIAVAAPIVRTEVELENPSMTVTVMRNFDKPSPTEHGCVISSTTLESPAYCKGFPILGVRGSAVAAQQRVLLPSSVWLYVEGTIDYLSYHFRIYH